MSLWRLALAVIVMYVKKPFRGRSYRRLLIRIDALERDMQMGAYTPKAYVGQFTQIQRDPYSLSLAPGAKWLVDDPSDVVLYRKALEYAVHYAPVYSQSSCIVLPVVACQ